MSCAAALLPQSTVRCLPRAGPANKACIGERLGGSGLWQAARTNPINGPPAPIKGQTTGQTDSTPHQRAMNSAIVFVTRRIDSISTRSSNPWMLSDVGP